MAVMVTDTAMDTVTGIQRAVTAMEDTITATVMDMMNTIIVTKNSTNMDTDMATIMAMLILPKQNWYQE